MSLLNDHSYYYPPYIIDEFFLLLGNIFEGQTGPHIGEARQRSESVLWFNTGIRERVSRALALGQAQSLSS